MNLRKEQKVKFWLFIITKTLAMVLVIYKLIDLFIDKQVQGAIGPYNQAIEIGQIVSVKALPHRCPTVPSSTACSRGHRNANNDQRPDQAGIGEFGTCIKGSWLGL